MGHSSFVGLNRLYHAPFVSVNAFGKKSRTALPGYGKAVQSLIQFSLSRQATF